MSDRPRSGRARRWRSGGARCAAIAVLLAAGPSGCGGDAGGDSIPAAVVTPLRAAGPLRPCILYPRHRIASLAPPVILFVPADPGPIDLEVRLTSGRVRRFATRERVVPWPASWPPLESGESGTVVLRSCGQTACAWFVCAPWKAPLLAIRHAPDGTGAWLERGLPVEAFRLAARDAWSTEGFDPQLRIRTGLPWPGMWQGR
jgi:hypothetical protein